MNVIFFSAVNYTDPSKNNGDCILIDTGSELVVYDCGCEEHAKRVESYMRKKGYQSLKVILSHNDADHFDGIPYLVDQGLVTEVYALLLLKYKDELLNRIDDKRRNRHSIGETIKEIYSNISSLSGRVTLKDIFMDTNVANGITILGPDKDYSLNAVAQKIDSREGDHVDKETIVNAVSTQVSVCFDFNRKLLLTGDSSFKAIEESIKDHSAIQLPHHGKLDQAEEIFASKSNDTIYFVSDNTGDSNGGSNDLRDKHSRGHAIYNTLSCDQTCSVSSFKAVAPCGSYFRGTITCGI